MQPFPDEYLIVFKLSRESIVKEIIEVSSCKAECNCVTS